MSISCKATTLKKPKHFCISGLMQTELDLVRNGFNLMTRICKKSESWRVSGRALAKPRQNAIRHSVTVIKDNLRQLRLLSVDTADNS